MIEDLSTLLFDFLNHNTIPVICTQEGEAEVKHTLHVKQQCLRNAGTLWRARVSRKEHAAFRLKNWSLVRNVQHMLNNVFVHKKELLMPLCKSNNSHDAAPCQVNKSLEIALFLVNNGTVKRCSTFDKNFSRLKSISDIEEMKQVTQGYDNPKPLARDFSMSSLYSHPDAKIQKLFTWFSPTNIDYVIDDNEQRAKFKEFAATEMCDEGLLFIEQVLEYKSLKRSDKRILKANQILSSYIERGSQFEVNINDMLRQELKHQLSKNGPITELFDPIATDIKLFALHDCFLRYKKTANAKQ